MAITSRNQFGAFGAATYWSRADLNSQGSILTLQTPSGPQEIEVPPGGSRASYGFGRDGEVEVYNPGANNEIFVDGRSISPGKTIVGEAGYVQDNTFVANKGHQKTQAEREAEGIYDDAPSGSGGILKALGVLAGLGAVAFAANKKFGKK